jgi:HEAT repeat protein
MHQFRIGISAAVALGALGALSSWLWTADPDLFSTDPAARARLRARRLRAHTLDDERPPAPPGSGPAVTAGLGAGRLTPEEVQATARSFRDPSRPVATRAGGLRALAAAGDPDSIEVLKALGDERCYLSWVAVEALGAVDRPSARRQILAYLAGKMTDDDPRVAEAAIRAYGRLAGEAAVGTIAAAVRANRGRPDGYRDLVNAAAARTLGALGSQAAVPILAEELARARVGAWDYEYGSKLVAALALIEHASAKRAIQAYAAWIGANLPQDPMARRYVTEKIDEARRAAP